MYILAITEYFKYILLGWVILPKVLKFMVFRHFPIHLDPRTSPSEKISIYFEIYYPGKPVEVLLYKLPSSDFGQSHLALKNTWKSWTSDLIFSGGPIRTSWTSQKKFGVWGPHPMGGPGPPECPLWGSRAPHWVGPPDPNFFLGSSGSPNRPSRKN